MDKSEFIHFGEKNRKNIFLKGKKLLKKWNLENVMFLINESQKVYMMIQHVIRKTCEMSFIAKGLGIKVQLYRHW